MEDSLSSSYNSGSTRRKKKSGRNSSRGGPEGDSLGVTSQIQIPKMSTSTPATVSPTKKRRSRAIAINQGSSSEPDENVASPSKKAEKRKVSGKSLAVSQFESFDSCDSKKSRVSSDVSMEQVSRISKKKGKGKKSIQNTDLSWEMAVEKARGMPDGAFNSGGESEEEEMDEDEIDVDAPVPEPTEKTQKKAASDKVKSKPLNVIQTAAKKLKQMKSKGSDSESPRKSSKRKSDDDLNDEDKKKSKSDIKKDRKDIKVERRSKKNLNYDVSVKAKSLWEQLRRYDLPHEKRHQISTELYNLVKGKTKELIFAHDTSRVIQWMMKYCSQEHKNAVFEELKNSIVDMAKSKYAKFFIRKLLKYGTKAQRNYVFRMFYGNVRKLIKHKEAAEVIECAYNDYANAMQRHALVEEFYGPSFALFKTNEQKSLEQIIQSNPEKRDSILSNMKETLSSLVEKSVLQYSIVHRVFMEFFSIATDKLRTEMIETVREGVVHMLHTREGAKVTMVCLWHGSAKDRKVIVKSFKTYIAKICKEENGYLVLMAMFDCVDDTKLVQKVILDEMLKSVHDLALDQYGRKVLLYLLSARDPLHFHPDVVKILRQGDGNTHSKKENANRQNELLDFVSRPLVQYIKQNCEELVTNSSALLLILSIITHARADPTDAMRAVSELAAQPFVAGNSQKIHIVDHVAGHLTLKRLILNDAQRMKDGQSALFSGILLDILPAGSLKSWAACNRGCFILITLLELDNPEVVQKVCREILPIKESLRKMDFKGAQVLLTKLKG